jgi:hypothetical protein
VARDYHGMPRVLRPDGSALLNAAGLPDGPAQCEVRSANAPHGPRSRTGTGSTIGCPLAGSGGRTGALFSTAGRGFGRRRLTALQRSPQPVSLDLGINGQTPLYRYSVLRHA